MMVGVCRVDVYLPYSGSLKEKRFILNSLKTRIRNKFNVSISEVDGVDKWQRSTLGIACITNDRRLIDQTFSQIVEMIDRDNRMEVIDHFTEIF